MMHKKRPGMMRLKVRAIGVAITALAVALGLGVPSAAAAESYPASSTGFALVGHGFGHGRGLSQWGAYGAATKGLTLGAILDFYYPGTTRAALPNAPIRVKLSTGSTSRVAVDALGVMSLTVSGTKTALPAVESSTGRAISSWRLVPDSAGTGLRVEFTRAGSTTWVAFRTLAATSADLSSDRGSVRLIHPDDTRREYRGSLRALRSGGSVTTINVVSMESYLRGVVPVEMPASWPATALAAQAVAARTYAAYKRSRATGSSDICDTTACQVYAGKASFTATGTLVRTYETSATNAAITASGLQAIYYKGALALTEFSASNGGYTKASLIPYQVAKPDPYDGAVPNKANTWTKTVTLAAVRNAWPEIGTPKALVVTGRDGKGEWGGRVTGVQIVGSAGTVSVTGGRFASALGLKSTWWRGASP